MRPRKDRGSRVTHRRMTPATDEVRGPLTPVMEFPGSGELRPAIKRRAKRENCVRTATGKPAAGGRRPWTGHRPARGERSVEDLRTEPGLKDLPTRVAGEF